MTIEEIFKNNINEIIQEHNIGKYELDLTEDKLIVFLKDNFILQIFKSNRIVNCAEHLQVLLPNFFIEFV